jgi:predicted ATPase/DNA-binding SARP family transcriptional activator/tetratricopeptide (TPR) repeat protein
MAGVTGDVRIGILGPLELRTGSGERVEVVGPRLRTLLIRLALDPGRVILGDQLIDAVWGERPPAGAANALQSLVSRLRRVLPGAIESNASGYRLALDPEVVDAVRFERLAMAGRGALRRDPLEAATALRQALALWRGPALADAATAPFAAPTVARLEELRLSALEDRIEADLVSGVVVGGETLVAELDGLVTVHPTRERLCGQLMRALARAGRQADALAVYERVRTRLADQLGMDPSEELEAAHLQVLRGEDTARAGRAGGRDGGVAPPPPVPDGPAAVEQEVGGPADGTARTNLRARISSFVGRDDDLARIGPALGSARLVTLTGSGGAGKTRLASEVAAGLRGSFPDGVWMVELAPVADPGELPRAVWSLFGTREVGLLPHTGGAVPPEQQLIDAFDGKRLLLLMDNCEHLVTAAAALIERLLASCPGLRVLATSREPLGITGEILHPVEPLALPGDGVTPDEALLYPAVRLFADRGAAVRPNFAVDNLTLQPVLRICRALDGIPLAIELAAARLSALSPEQIAARLGDRFRLLAGAGRPVPPRHQTLRAVIDWSWDLLDDAERRLLRRLAVFSGGATLEAAEQVCAGPCLAGVPPDEVLYLLAALVDKSLVTAREATPSGEVRYSLLETIRAYSDERQRAAGEDRALRRAHAEHFLRLAEQAEPRLRRADQLVWMGKLTAERDNLHAALRWAVETREAGLALRLVTALSWYWLIRSERTEAIEWIDKVLALPGAQATSLLRAQALTMHAFVALTGGRGFGRALAGINEAEGIVGDLPRDLRDHSHPWLTLQPILASLFRADEAGAHRQARALSDHPDPWVRGMARVVSGGFLISLGRAAEAEAELGRGLAELRALGERWGIGQALLGLAELRATRAEHDAVVAALEEARRVLSDFGSSDENGQLLIRLAQEHARAGRMEQARADLDAAHHIANAVGADDQRVMIRRALADIARWEGRFDEAKQLLERAFADIARWKGNFFEAKEVLDAVLDGGGEPSEARFPSDAIYGLALTARGHIDLDAGDLDGARAWCWRAISVSIRSGDQPIVARAVELLAAITLVLGDAREAASQLGMAEVLRGLPDEADRDVLRVRAATRAALGDKGFAHAYQRGAAWRRDEVLDALAAGSHPPPEAPESKGREHHRDSRTPGQRPQHRSGDLAADGQATDRVGEQGDRVDLHERLQPSGHRRRRNERAAREGQREHDDEAKHHDLLRLVDHHGDEHR